MARRHRPQGTIGTEPNLIAPGKRMLSSQTPTIVAKDGKVLLVTGSPGSRTIINTVLCMVVNVLDFDMDIQAAVDAPRMHHQWFPDTGRNSRTRPMLAAAVAQLRAMGHVMNVGRRPGRCPFDLGRSQDGRLSGRRGQADGEQGSRVLRVSRRTVR